MNRSADAYQDLVSLAEEFVHEQFNRNQEHDTDHGFDVMYQRLQEDLCCADLEEIPDEERYGDMDAQIWGTRTTLTDMFSSEILLSYRCQSCGNSESGRMEDYQPMFLHITTNGDSLSDALAKSMMSEGEKECAVCCSMRKCQIVKHVVNPPTFLKIVMDGGLMKAHAIDSDVAVGGVSYQFLGAIIYTGDGESGHYRYLKKDERDGHWLLHDDAVVKFLDYLPMDIIQGANIRSYRRRQ